MKDNNLPWEHDKKIENLHDDAFFRLMRNIIIKTPGVVSICSKKIMGLRDLFSEKRKYKKAIVIEKSHDNLNLSISIAIRAGIKIYEIASQLQISIKEELSTLTGKVIDKVYVKIERIVS